MKHLADSTWQITKPTPIHVGKPRIPPSLDALAEMRAAVSNMGATTIYWFWVSINNDQPHLGLAVSPNDVVSTVGQALEPIWQRHSPQNSKLDVFRLDNSNLHDVFRNNGESLL
jgi:hypothetical protein